MKKILITGCAGFVAHNFLDFIKNNRLELDVYGIDISKPAYGLSEYEEFFPLHFEQCDMLSYASVNEIIGRVRPDYILHLASFSSVAYSWKHPADSFCNNTNIFLNLVEAVRENCENCRILSVGSSEEYGIVKEENIPLIENQILNPINPYAVARVSQEMLGKVFCENYGLQIIFTRSFNHVGKYQDNRFAIPDFVSRLVAAGNVEQAILSVGNVDVVRDFIDVRDVVRAYYLLLESGSVGEIYNVCAGRGHTLRTIIDLIGENLGMKVDLEIDAERVRPSDNPIIIGSYDKIMKDVGWKPQYEIEDSIEDLIAWNKSLMK